ncbi:MAG: TrkA family potassium uptake protein [Coriobacteriales bacterium]|jgi:trk system potassium uptake protein TrkA|nr:TrkA family potassium uptake protein [Coriobacteriales bacterium]
MYVVINGGGKIGEYLASTLLKKGHEVAIIEKSSRKIDHLAITLPSKALMINGDGCDSVFQADAGTEEADIFVATTGSDDVNLVSCEIAHAVFSVSRVIARVNSPKNERIFRRIGIEPVSSTSVISRLIESEATAGAVQSIMSLTQGDLVVTEVNIPRDMETPLEEWSGRRVMDIALPDGALLVAVGRGTDLEIVKGSTILYPGDAVICISKRGVEEAIHEALSPTKET